MKSNQTTLSTKVRDVKHGRVVVLFVVCLLLLSHASSLYNADDQKNIGILLLTTFCELYGYVFSCLFRFHFWSFLLT